MLTQNTLETLRHLKLHGMAQALEEQRDNPSMHALAFEERFALLVDRERLSRHNSRYRGLLRDARLKVAQACVEDINYKANRGLDKAQIAALADGAWIERSQNLLITGPTGVGKTGLMSALVLKAVQNGHRALFIKAQDLFDEMYSSLADRSTRRLIRSLARVDLLAIDEMGYLNIKPEQTNIFFKLMEKRHHRRPTLITTNLPYSAWQDFLGNRPLTQALLSRLRERCHTVIIDGPCLRSQQG